MSLWLFGLVTLGVWFVMGVTVAIRAEARIKNDSRTETAKGVDGAVHYIRNLARTLTLATLVCYLFIWLASVGILPAGLVLHTFEAIRWVREEIVKVGSFWTTVGTIILFGGLFASALHAGKLAKVLNSKGLFNTMTKPSKSMTIAATILLVPALIGIAEGADLTDRLSASAMKAQVTLSKEKLEKQLEALNQQPDDLTPEEHSQIHAIAQDISYRLRVPDVPSISPSQEAEAYKVRADAAKVKVLKESAVPTETRLADFRTFTPWDDEVRSAVTDDVTPKQAGAEVEPDIDPIEKGLTIEARKDSSFRAKLKDYAASFHEEVPFNERFSQLVGRVVENRVGSILGEEPASYIGGLAESAGINDTVTEFVQAHRESSEVFFNRTRARFYLAGSQIAEGEDLNKTVSDATHGPLVGSGTTPADRDASNLMADSLSHAQFSSMMSPADGKSVASGSPAIEPDFSSGGGGSGGTGGGSGPGEGGGSSRVAEQERATYSEMFPASEEAVRAIPSEVTSGLGEVESVGAGLARDFAMLEGAGEVGGVLIGRAADGSDQMDVRDIGWEPIVGDDKMIRLLLTDQNGSVHPSAPYHKETVLRALAYAADGRPVTYTMPLTKDGRIEATHPALIGSPLQNEMVRVDCFTDDFTITYQEYALRNEAEGFFSTERFFLREMYSAKTGNPQSTASDSGLGQILSDAIRRIGKMDPDKLTTLATLMANPAVMGTDKRSFLAGRLDLKSAKLPYGTDLITNLEDMAPRIPSNAAESDIEAAFSSEFNKISAHYNAERKLTLELFAHLKSDTSDFKEVTKDQADALAPILDWITPPQPRAESGVRELPFKMDYDSILMSGQEPPVVIGFTLVNVYDDGRANPSPFNFPLIAENLNKTVYDRAMASSRSENGKSDAEVFRDVCEFTILQRLFRAAFEGRLGYDFPVEKLGELTKTVK